MYDPKACPNCSHLCLPSDARCPRCRHSLGLGWVNWLPGITATIFALLMAAFVFYVAMPASARGSRPDKVAVIATNLTNVIFIGGAALIGALLGWLVALVIKSATKR